MRKIVLSAVRAGVLCCKMLALYIRASVARQKAVREASRAMVEQGVPPGTARQLARELPRPGSLLPVIRKRRG